jgi:hypothetical protein
MDERIAYACRAARSMREHLPHLEFYCPHEWETLLRAGIERLVALGGDVQAIEKTILDMDCNILRMGDGLVVLTPPDESVGVRRELREALEKLYALRKLLER